MLGQFFGGPRGTRDTACDELYTANKRQSRSRRFMRHLASILHLCSLLKTEPIVMQPMFNEASSEGSGGAGVNELGAA